MGAAGKAAAARAEQKLDNLEDAVEVLGDDVDALSLITEGGFEETHEHLDKAHAQLDAVEVKVDKTRTALNRAEEGISSLVSAMWGAGGLIALGLAALALVPTHGARAQLSAAPPPSPAPQIIVVTAAAQGGTPLAFDVQALLGAVSAQQMGSKVVDNPIPSQPLPYQKVAPCLEEAGEKAIEGSCWFRSGDVKPPCGRYLFRHDDGCYRPVAADPKKSVGIPPGTADQQRPL